MLIDLLERLLAEGLARAKQLYLDTGKITPENFQVLVDKDPTQQKKYIEWMCAKFVQGTENNTLNDFIDHIDAVGVFDKLVNRRLITGPETDINSYKTLGELVDKVNSLEDVKTKGEQRRSEIVAGASIVFENEKVVIYQIHTKKASQHLGLNDVWCTAYTKVGTDYFTNYYYEKFINLYYILPKKEYKDLRKWAVSVMPNGHTDIWDDHDNSNRISMADLYQMFDIS